MEISTRPNHVIGIYEVIKLMTLFTSQLRFPVEIQKIAYALLQIIRQLIGEQFIIARVFH